MIGWKEGIKYLLREFRELLQGRGTGVLWLLVSLFLYIAITNFNGLLPYVFAGRRHLPFAVSLALPLWRGIIIHAFVYQPLYTLAHLVPTGTPVALLPFIVIIETIRNCIRPLTLSVRLVANILAGHLLLSLRGGIAPITNWRILIILILVLLALRILETGVAIIQAYVFSALTTLYCREVNSPYILTKSWRE